jgi:hypothetical protein
MPRTCGARSRSSASTEVAPASTYLGERRPVESAREAMLRDRSPTTAPTTRRSPAAAVLIAPNEMLNLGPWTSRKTSSQSRRSNVEPQS